MAQRGLKRQRDIGTTKLDPCRSHKSNDDELLSKTLLGEQFEQDNNNGCSGSVVRDMPLSFLNSPTIWTSCSPRHRADSAFDESKSTSPTAPRRTSSSPVLQGIDLLVHSLSLAGVTCPPVAFMPPSKPPVPEDYDVRFEMLCGGVWVPMDEQASKNLSRVFNRGSFSSAVMSLESEGKTTQSVFDFMRMVEINCNSSRQRAFRWTDYDTDRLVPPPVAWEHPKFMLPLEAPWHRHDLPEGMLLPVHKSGSTFLNIAHCVEKYHEDYKSTNRVVVAVHEISMSAHNHFWGRRQEVFNLTKRQLESVRDASCSGTLMGWHGTSIKSLICILSGGFSVGAAVNGRAFGHGVYLASFEHAGMSAEYSECDENGIKHMLLCQVLLGNVEVGKHMQMSSSDTTKYDNGVDNLVFPTKYVVWPANITTHLLPRYVVSFRTIPSRS